MIDPVINVEGESAMVGKLDDYLRFNEAALSLRSQRQSVLASNIANGDTPNYKARDIDFSSALSAALDKASPSAAATLKTTAGKHYPNPPQDGSTMADGCCTAAWCRARSTATRSTWTSNATSSPITPSATRLASQRSTPRSNR
jgi:flagellar basal body rod protein FlgB